MLQDGRGLLLSLLGGFVLDQLIAVASFHASIQAKVMLVLLLLLLPLFGQLLILIAFVREHCVLTNSVETFGTVRVS